MTSGVEEGDAPIDTLVKLPKIPEPTTYQLFKFVVAFFSMGVLSYVLIIFVIFFIDHQTVANPSTSKFHPEGKEQSQIQVQVKVTNEKMIDITK